jgi:AcrR family transcriptional regulator
MLDKPLARPGLRERNKIEKLRRIKDAARKLFVSKGFDDTTTREIAIRAGVGIGTVFIYADNKRDLLFLAVNDALEQVTAEAEESVKDDAFCLQNLLTVFRRHYEFFARQPELSRLMLREMTFYDSGRQAARFGETRQRIIRLVGRIVGSALTKKTLVSTEDPAFIGWVVFCIYQVELRDWITSTDISVPKGMDRLRRALELFLRGLQPSKQALLLSEERGKGS